MKLIRYVLTFILFSFILNVLTGCGAVKMKIFGASTDLPSVGDVAVPPSPMGLFNLVLTNTLGKNKWVETTLIQTNSAHIIDSLNQTHLLGADGIHVFDIHGNQTKFIPIAASYIHWLDGAVFDLSSNGDYYILDKSAGYNTNQGILKVSADGTSIINLPDAGHDLPSGGYDLKIIKRANNSEEIHVTRFNLQSGGQILENDVAVFDLSGSLLKIYFTPVAGVTLFNIRQNPVNLEIFISDMNSNNIKHFDDSSAILPTITIPGTQIMSFGFDNTGKLYINERGDVSILDCGTDTGITVYDISSFPYTILRQIKNTTGQLKCPLHITVNPNGLGFDIFNQFYGLQERYTVASSNFQFSEYIGSMGSGTNELSIINASALGVIEADSNENIYIDDSRNNRIKVYSSKTGAVLRTFSTANTHVNDWQSHFLSVTADNKILSGGWNQTGSVHTLYINKYSNTGTLESSNTFIAPSAFAAFDYIGVDDQGRIWLDDVFNSHLYAVNSNGVAEKTVDYTNNTAAFGVSYAAQKKVAGSYIYTLDSGNFHINKTDFNGTSSEFIGASQLADANLFAVLASDIKILPDGKMMALAYDISATFVMMIVIDPAQNGKVVGKINSTDLPAMGSKVWTSSGLFALAQGTNQLLQYFLQ